MSFENFKVSYVQYPPRWAVQRLALAQFSAPAVKTKSPGEPSARTFCLARLDAL
jgi:hypothetical protein